MTQRPNLARPCSAILQTAGIQKGRVVGNDSSSVWDCMTWGYEGNLANLECRHNQNTRHYLSQSAQLAGQNYLSKCECCEDGQIIDATTQYYSARERDQTNQSNRNKGRTINQQPNRALIKSYQQQQKQTRGAYGTGGQQNTNYVNKNLTNQKRAASKAKSPPFQSSPAYNRMQVEEIKKRRLNDLIQSNKQKSLQRAKVQAYVESQKPFSRGMSNTKFRTFYGKQCMQAYGRNNTNEPIGGIIYGNHLKTFNINPHASSNDPKYYQTHTTALNFAKRSKLDEEKNWNLLEKQLGKQLNLKAVNQTLIPGKDIVYQQVTPDNMYAAMKVNHQFAKNNRQQIRDQERQYKRNQVLKQWAIQDQYKAQRQQDKQILKNAPLGSTMAASEAQEEFRRAVGSSQEGFNRQVIYKMIDSQGNIRYGADRHSLTCFVDTNFPQNQAAYTAELINRNQIFPIKVKEQDRHLDEIRKQNYVQSVINNYPAHYLIPNVDLSKVVLRPGADKRTQNRSVSKQKRPQSSYVGTKPQTAVFQNTKVGANLNQNKVNVIGSPKNQTKNRVQFDNNNQIDKNNYFNQSTKMTLGKTQPVHNQSQHAQHGAIHGETSSYANTLKNALLDQSTKNPHFATQLLVQASHNPYTIPSKNQRLVNEQYDARNYYPHANHELKPQLHHHIKATKIPYAGVESNILDALH